TSAPSSKPCPRADGRPDHAGLRSHRPTAPMGSMRYLHTMIRVKDLEAALDFFVHKLGLVETRRKDNEKGKFTLVFLATAPGAPELELTYTWGQEEPYSVGRNFGHVAFEVDDLYATCTRL